MIGKQGASVRKITQEFPKVHIEFTEGENKIKIEGPPEEVEDAVKALETIVRDLVRDSIWTTGITDNIYINSYNVFITLFFTTCV